jgi:trimeric autotransporter adhesin
MTRKLSLAALSACLILTCTLVVHAQGSLVVYPNIANFGTGDLNSTGYPVTFYLSNTSATTSLLVTSMTISGANASSFAFDGPNCVTTISVNQICQMYMTMTPLAMGPLAATLKITVSGAPSTTTVPLQGIGGNPYANITAVSPSTVYQGSAATKLTITGTGFLTSSVAYVNQSPIPTTYVSSTQLTAQVPASDLSSQGGQSLFVVNPAPGGGSSGSFTFQVVSLDPYINSVSPTSLVAGTASTQIAISGGSFASGATVLWNGTALPTTYTNSGQLQAQVSAADLATATIVQLSVSNPSPGGVSDSTIFDVTYPATVLTLDLPANDLVWDPFTQLIYASLPSSYGVNGNTIAAINPTTGAVAYHFAGSEPTKLALSGNGTYLYVGLDGDGSVQRFILPAFTPDISVNLETSTSGQLVAGSLAVSPTDAHMFALTSTTNCCEQEGQLEFFTDKTLLNKLTNTEMTDLIFANATTLYGYASGEVSEVTVSSTGGKLGTQWSGLVEGTEIAYDAGLIYGSSGQVFNPAIGELTGTFDVGAGCCSYSNNQILPDAAINRAFSVGVTPFFESFGITSYNLSEFTPVGVANLEQLTNDVAAKAIQWGSSGVAFIAQSNCCNSSTPQVILVTSPEMLLTTGKKNNPKPAISSLTPATAAHGSGNFKVQIQGTGFVPGSRVTWNGKQLSMDYLSTTSLRAYVPGSAIASSGTAAVVVTNPPPAGGASTPMPVPID